MRFMMFMYAGTEESDYQPSAELVEAMSRYNEELRKAGLLLAIDGLRPPSDGGTVNFAADGGATISDGPYAEAKEVVGGYWLIQARSREEALEWASRCPVQGAAIEVRRVAEVEDFPEDVQRALATNEGI